MTSNSMSMNFVTHSMAIKKGFITVREMRGWILLSCMCVLQKAAFYKQAKTLFLDKYVCNTYSGISKTFCFFFFYHMPPVTDICQIWFANMTHIPVRSGSS